MEENKYVIYPRPTVSQVIFQIKYSNLFMIEDRIGSFQNKIIDKFPESSLSLRRQIILADVGQKIDTIPSDESFTKKIWQFKSEKDYILNVSTSTLDITSRHHKSYQSVESENGFRNIIKFSVDHFLDLIPIKLIKRIGLRYIDDCPIPSMEIDVFKEWYNTVLPIDRFNLKQVGSMIFETKKVNRGDYFLTYRENFVPTDREGKEFKFYLDFDGFKENISPDDYLAVLDDLHELIHNEWEETIKEPIKEWMNKKVEI